MSTLFLRTLREDPADAEVASHRLLVRAGYIRRAAPGGFTWLPIGWIVLRNVERIVREEMDRAGFQEVHFPALLPREPYEATHRWTDYGDSLFRLQDRRKADLLLAPTHEEMFTLLVKDLLSSYKDLPVSLYQIQTKFRDEARPRAGLLRGREFVMKDSYSFDVDDEGLAESYRRHREAYVRVFERLGLPFVIVSAMSGAMGGSASEEFLTPLDVGEDTFVRCTACGYAANTEAVRVAVPGASDGEGATDREGATGGEGAPPPVTVPTPGATTIAALVDELDRAVPREDRPWQAGDTLKHVIVKLRKPDGTTEALAIGLPGDREVDMRRLEAQVAPDEPELFDDADFARYPLLRRGFIGPGVLGSAGPAGVRYLVDPRLVDGSRWASGADEVDRHVVGLVVGRDIHPDGTIEAAEVRAGDACPICGGPLDIERGIEIGHIFQLGRKYAEALGLTVLDQHGKQVVVTMGSYGIGVTRAVGVIAEATLDAAGLCWPREIAPADVHLVATGKPSDPQLPAAVALAEQLEAAGVRVLLDDRPGVSAGVRFNDAELIGVPTIVVVGKGLASGTIEVRDRRSGERVDVPVDGALDHLARLVAGEG